MRVSAILPPFLPISEIRKGVDNVMPGVEIRTNTEFETSDAEVLIVTTFTPVDASLIKKFPQLKFIQVASTGYDNVDLEAVKSMGIKLSNAPGSNKESVAEHVIAMVLAFLKDLRFLDGELRKGNWPVLTASRDLMGKTFGIIGMGAIGRRLVERLIALQVGILYYDVRRLSTEEEDYLGVTYSNLEDLLKESDIISIHVPLDANSRSLISAKELSMLKDGAILINTSRGGVVDEKALIDAIKKKGIHAGVDVYEQEPPDFSSDLFKLDNVLLSPHIAGVTLESQARFLQETMANVIRFVQGVDPQNLVIG